MEHPIHREGHLKQPRRRAEEQHEQYGRDHAGGSLCPTCRNIHYLGRWHQADSDVLAELKTTVNHEFRRERCPACKMIEGHTFEGELFIEHFPESTHEELMNLIHAYAKRAEIDDPQARIIDIEDTEKGQRITTTENQLAVRLGKKIKDTFNAVNLNISHAKEPQEVSRVHAVYKKLED